MAYDIHITRADHWLESSETPITETEWKQYVSIDPQLKVVDGIHHTTPQGSTLSIGGEFVTFTIDDFTVPFRYNKGRITVSGAGEDEDVLEKMRQIASALHAKVQGDEGELY